MKNPVAKMKISVDIECFDVVYSIIQCKIEDLCIRLMTKTEEQRKVSQINNLDILFMRTKCFMIEFNVNNDFCRKNSHFHR